MRRSELIGAVAEMFSAGAMATDVLVVVRVRPGPGVPESVAVFGDVGDPALAAWMLRRAAVRAEESRAEGFLLDGSEALLATLRLPTPADEETLSDPLPE